MILKHQDTTYLPSKPDDLKNQTHNSSHRYKFTELPKKTEKLYRLYGAINMVLKMRIYVAYVSTILAAYVPSSAPHKPCQ